MFYLSHQERLLKSKGKNSTPLVIESLGNLAENSTKFPKASDVKLLKILSKLLLKPQEPISRYTLSSSELLAEKFELCNTSIYFMLTNVRINITPNVAYTSTLKHYNNICKWVYVINKTITLQRLAVCVAYTTSY